MTIVSEKKTEAVNAYLIKESKGEGTEKEKKKREREREREHMP